MNFEFTGKVWFWHGPSPFYFVSVPEEQSQDLKAVSGFVTYGWGMIPVHAQIGQSQWATALWPKDGRYIVPIKTSVRKAEELEIDDLVTIRLKVG
jgi:hypothetical protein